MSEPPLQFETAEGMAAESPSCSICHAPFAGDYHELNGHPVCAVCRAREEAVYAQDLQWSRFVTAAVYGLGAAFAGGLLYWGFVKLTHIEFGLMAIAVGWLVGKAVMKGSNMRGGRRYQFLALGLTYFSITLSYGAMMVEQIIKARPAKAEVQGEVKPAPPAPSAGAFVVGIAMLILIVLAAPFLGGLSNVLGLVIIAIGLFEAWKQTRLVPFSSGGPYRLGGAASAE